MTDGRWEPAFRLFFKGGSFRMEIPGLKCDCGLDAFAKAKMAPGWYLRMSMPIEPHG